MIEMDRKFVVGITRNRQNIVVWKLGDAQPHVVLNRDDYDTYVTGHAEWADVQSDILFCAQFLGWVPCEK